MDFTDSKSEIDELIWNYSPILTCQQQHISDDIKADLPLFSSKV